MIYSQEEETFFPLPLTNMMDLEPGSWLYQYLPVKPKKGMQPIIQDFL